MDILLMGRAAYASCFSAPGPEDRTIARKTLEAFDLGHLEGRDYTRLSGGETQLVMIMRALVQDSPIVVMDEPTAHLDFRHELHVLETIARLVKQERKTLIMATHSPNHAFYLENEGIDVNVAFMRERAILPAGKPSAALTEENLVTHYGVETHIISHAVPGRGSVRQIIPIKTHKES
jgi:iron complex transport system ATP-binding protein